MENNQEMNQEINQKNNEKSKFKKSKGKKRLNKAKLIRFLFIACATVLIFKFILDKNLFDDMKIQNRVNSSYAPTSVGIKEALSVKLYAFENYIGFIKSGNMKKAYLMLTDEYREYKSYSEFLKDIEKIDISTFKLKEVKLMSGNTYITPVEYMTKDGELCEETYIIIANKINKKNMKISPNNFLYNFTKKIEFKEDDIKFVIEKCEVYADNINLTLKIKNNNFFKDIDIREIGMEFVGNTVSMKSIEDGKIEARKSKKFDIELDANYNILKVLRVNININDEVMAKYKFEL